MLKGRDKQKCLTLRGAGIDGLSKGWLQYTVAEGVDFWCDNTLKNDFSLNCCKQIFVIRTHKHQRNATTTPPTL